MTKIPHDDILEGLYKLRIRESDKLKTVLELYDLETHQKKLGPDYHRLKAMVKRSIEQEIRNKNFGARSGPTIGEIPVREREDAPNNDISPVPVSEFVDDRSGRPDETQANKTPKTNKKETTTARGDPLCSDDSEIPEWLQEFRENLVDDEIPLQGDAHASSSHEASLEPIEMRRVDLGKHNVHTHFP